jgi:CHRD domain-containing protein
MTKFKLTAGSAILVFIFSLILISCEKPLNIDENVYTKTGIPMTGTQVVPPNTSAATGTMDIIYVRGEHTLTYTLNWTGLSGAPTTIANVGPAIGVYGPADAGYLSPAAPLQSITSGFSSATTATYKGSLFVDNVYIKESDLLNNKFYITIRTAAYPAGQLRGQVDFR